MIKISRVGGGRAGNDLFKFDGFCNGFDIVLVGALDADFDGVFSIFFGGGVLNVDFGVTFNGVFDGALDGALNGILDGVFNGVFDGVIDGVFDDVFKVVVGGAFNGACKGVFEIVLIDAEVFLVTIPVSTP